MGKAWNRLDNTLSIHYRAINTVGQGGIDIINTIVGVPRDLTSVVLSTKNKIANLFSKDLKRYQKIWNIPVAGWVWLAWAVEAVIKPLVNGVANTWKTAVNFVTNARKSTLWSLFSTKPVSDISYNTIKIKGNPVHLNTTEDLRDRNSLLTQNWWILTKEKKIELLTERLRKLWAAA